MKVKCSSCGMEFEGVFCPNCGAKNEEITNGNSNGVMATGINQSFVMEKPKKKSNVVAILSLICGIFSVCTFGVFIIPDILAIIFGVLSKQEEKRPQIGNVGLVCGIISVAIFVLLMIVGVVMGMTA